MKAADLSTAEAPSEADLAFLDSEAFVLALANDDGSAAKRHLAAGRPVFYDDPRYTSEGVVKLHPDGCQQIVTMDENQVIRVIRDLA